jgi:NAD(P)-dependent dehydrogenase (short-subunit alcohol dehydrogenase family)
LRTGGRQEEWNREVSVNLGGVFLCSKHFMPHLRASRGNIISMSSVNASFVEPMCAGYCATKAAIIGLTKCVRAARPRPPPLLQLLLLLLPPPLRLLLLLPPLRPAAV